MSFSTVDLHLASFLRLSGHNVVNVTVNNRRGEFHFDDVPQDLINKYYLEQTQVEPLAYMHAVRSLTTLVRQTIERFNEKGKAK